MSNQSVIVYRSRAVFAMSDVDLFYLLAHSRANNKINEISGVMLYDRGHFFQWIEGPNQQLGRLWNKIRSDPRHTDVQVLTDQQVPVRLFEGWGMRFSHRDKQHQNNVEGFVVADPALLDDLHINTHKVPSILATFSKLGGSFRTVEA